MSAVAAPSLAAPFRASRSTERAIHAARAVGKGGRRRRFVDPTTCDREYAADEVEFMQALERYKRTNGRTFPTCSEVLGVLRSLGYAKTVQG